VATSGYINRMETGIRKLKDNLSRYIRRIEAGERISVTAHGRVVAELVPPGGAARTSPGSGWEELIAAGILHPPAETGDPFADWPDIRLPPGTAAELIDSDRGEA
jgi:antitoxin (DNA-binding transcriptional repressor) of toxin-antitoxin stability system